MFRRTRADAGVAGRGEPRMLLVRPTPAEAAMHAALMAYGRRAWAEASGDRARGARLAMTVLARRACSSAGSLGALGRTEACAPRGPAGSRPSRVCRSLTSRRTTRSLWRGWGRRRCATAARSGRCFASILELVPAAPRRRESKLACISRLIRRIGEPAIVFTEYRDTLERLSTVLAGNRAPCSCTAARRGRSAWTCSPGSRRAGPSAAGHRRRERRSQSSAAMPACHQPGAAVDARAARSARRTGRSNWPAPYGARHPPGRRRHDARNRSWRDLPRAPIGFAARWRRCRMKRQWPSPCSVPPDFHRPDPCRRPVYSVSTCGARRSRKPNASSAQEVGARQPVTPASCVQCARGSARVPGGGVERLWAFRVTIVAGSNQILWETVLAAGAVVPELPDRSADATRLALRYGPVRQFVMDAAVGGPMQRLQEVLRQPLALWLRRELDIRRRHPPRTRADVGDAAAAGAVRPSQRPGGQCPGRPARRGALALSCPARPASRLREPRRRSVVIWRLP